MRWRFAVWVAVAALGVLLSGCGSTPDPNAEKKPEDGANPDGTNVIPWPEGQTTTGGTVVYKLEGATNISLAHLLTRPRAELAAQADECATGIAYLEQLHQQGRLPFLLLPDARLPLAVPVLRQA